MKNAFKLICIFSLINLLSVNSFAENGKLIRVACKIRDVLNTGVQDIIILEQLPSDDNNGERFLNERNFGIYRNSGRFAFHRIKNNATQVHQLSPEEYREAVEKMIKSAPATDTEDHIVKEGQVIFADGEFSFSNQIRPRVRYDFIMNSSGYDRSSMLSTNTFNCGPGYLVDPPNLEAVYDLPQSEQESTD